MKYANEEVHDGNANFFFLSWKRVSTLYTLQGIHQIAHASTVYVFLAY